VKKLTETAPYSNVIVRLLSACPGKKAGSSYRALLTRMAHFHSTNVTDFFFRASKELYKGG
jgi:hypothetical protein